METWIWWLVAGTLLYGYIGGVLMGAIIGRMEGSVERPPGWSWLVIFFLTWIWPIDVVGYLIWAYRNDHDVPESNCTIHQDDGPRPGPPEDPRMN